MNDQKKGQYLVFAGFLVGLVGFIWNSNERLDCSSSSTYGTGLIGALQKLNGQLREQACLQDSINSASTLLIIAGVCLLVVGLVIWFRKR